MTQLRAAAVVRVDREPAAAQRSITHELTVAARKYAGVSDGLLVSDYGYGAATPVNVTAIRANRVWTNIPITVDSRARMLEYRGATAATPNEPESKLRYALTLR